MSEDPNVHAPASDASFLWPTIGYALVVSTCWAAGYTLGGYRVDAADPAAVAKITEGIWFLLLLCAYYLNHTLIYDTSKIEDIVRKRRSALDRWNVHRAIAAPIYCLMAVALIIILDWSAWMIRAPSTTFRSLLRVVLATLPFLCLAVWRTHSWRKDDEARERIFRFRHRSITPALMTCFLPFMLGQSAISDWQTMLWTIIVLAAITSLLGGWLWYTLILATLAAVVGVAQPPQGASLFFGLMMALVMGIAESFKVSSRVITGIEFVPIDKSTGHAKGFKMPPDALYRCGTNIAATVLPPFFSLTYLITGTSTFWLIATTVSSSTGLLLWLGICPHGNHRIWRAIAFVMGILVPTLVIVGSIGGAEPYVIGDRMRDWIEKVSLSFNGLFVLLLMRGRTVLRELFRPWPPQIFLTRRACAIILLTISNTLLLVVSILERIAGDSGLGSELQNRALWLLIVYMAISMTCAAFIITRSPEQTEAAQSPPAGEGREPSARPTGSMRGQLVGALVSGRPSTSIIALVLTGTIIAKSSSTHLFFAFLRATPIFLVTWAGFILNDAYDWEKDRSSGKRRPIAEGLISRSSAVFLGCFALLMAISIELAVGTQVSLFVLAGVSCAVVGYSPFAFRVPLLKAFYTAALTCAPVYYGCSIAGTRCPSVGYLVLGGFMVGREILADVRDIDEDLAVGLKTVAHRLGRARSLRVGWSAMWIGAMCMLVLVGTPTGLALALGMILSLAASLLTSLRRGITEFTYSRLAMLLGALALSGLVR